MRMSKIPLLFLAVLLAVALLSACAPSQTATPTQVVPTDTTEIIEEVNDNSDTMSEAPTTKEEVPRITVEVLKERLDNGEAIFIGDTRAQSSFDASHIAGAVSFPTSEIDTNMADLDRDQHIVLYCT